MDLGKLLKWVVILVVLLIGWKALAPRVKAFKTAKTAATSTTGAKGDDSCVGRATSASNAWSNGLSRFINPPYDVEAWSSFASDVKQHISEAEAACSCESESCIKARGAMSDLRALVSEMDASVRSNSPPASDLVRRQEAIDNAIDEARGLISSRPQ
jgi:hypothetical protein